MSLNAIRENKIIAKISDLQYTDWIMLIGNLGSHARQKMDKVYLLKVDVTLVFDFEHGVPKSLNSDQVRPYNGLKSFWSYLNCMHRLSADDTHSDRDVWCKVTFCKIR